MLRNMVYNFLLSHVTPIKCYSLNYYHPGRVCQLVRASPLYTEGAGSIPGHGTYKNKSNASIKVEQQINVFPSPSSLSKINK